MRYRKPRQDFQIFIRISQIHAYLCYDLLCYDQIFLLNYSEREYTIYIHIVLRSRRILHYRATWVFLPYYLANVILLSDKHVTKYPFRSQCGCTTNNLIKLRMRRMLLSMRKYFKCVYKTEKMAPRRLTALEYKHNGFFESRVLSTDINSYQLYLTHCS